MQSSGRFNKITKGEPKVTTCFDLGISHAQSTCSVLLALIAAVRVLPKRYS